MARDGNRKPERRRTPVEHRDVFRARHAARCLDRIREQVVRDTGIRALEPSKPISVSAQVEPPRAFSELPCSSPIAHCTHIDFMMYVQLGVRREALTCRQQEPVVFGRLRQKAFDELERKRQRIPHELEVVIAFVDRPSNPN